MAGTGYLMGQYVFWLVFGMSPAKCLKHDYNALEARQYRIFRDIFEEFID